MQSVREELPVSSAVVTFVQSLQVSPVLPDRFLERTDDKPILFALREVLDCVIGGWDPARIHPFVALRL